MKGLLLCGALLGLGVSTAFASSMCVNSASLDSYITQNSTFANACQIGDKLFWGFTLATGPTAIGAEPTASQIQVQTIPGDGVSSIGIDFNSGGWYITDSIPIDQIISYNVATVSGAPIIKGATLTITGSLTGTGGSAQVQETPNPAVPGSPLSAAIPTPVSVSTNFSGNMQSTFGVTDHITLLGGRGVADAAHISVIENDFAENATVPEPLMTLPLGAGLFLFGFARRKRMFRS